VVAHDEDKTQAEQDGDKHHEANAEKHGGVVTAGEGDALHSQPISGPYTARADLDGLEQFAWVLAKRPNAASPSIVALVLLQRQGSQPVEARGRSGHSHALLQDPPVDNTCVSSCS